MDFNGNREYLDHLINAYREPQTFPKRRAELNARRRVRVEKSLASRPCYIPLTFTLPAAGQFAPVLRKTPELTYDTIIIGAVADNASREVLFRRAENEHPHVFVGEKTNLYLSLAELSGQAVQSDGGTKTIFYFTTPFQLPAGRQFSVSMFKTDTTADPETVNLTLIALRPFRAGFGNDILTATQSELVNRFITLRQTPEMRFLKQQITFNANGVAENVEFPRPTEPLLIRGVRTNLAYSTIEAGVEGEPKWTTGPTPIWALAAQENAPLANYNWFERNVFLPADGQLATSFKNTVDGVLTDNIGTSYTLTWACETM